MKYYIFSKRWEFDQIILLGECQFQKFFRWFLDSKGKVLKCHNSR